MDKKQKIIYETKDFLKTIAKAIISNNNKIEKRKRKLVRPITLAKQENQNRKMMISYSVLKRIKNKEILYYYIRNTLGVLESEKYAYVLEHYHNRRGFVVTKEKIDRGEYFLMMDCKTYPFLFYEKGIMKDVINKRFSNLSIFSDSNSGNNNN